jgi:hypothetical protein
LAKGKKSHKTKNVLALEMLEWAQNAGFPKATVLADSWFCVAPFIKGLNLLELPYILEAKCNYQLKCDCVKPKLTPKGRLAKNQFNLNSLPDYFQNISSFIECGFDRDLETKKPQKTLYHAKTATVCFKAFP